MCIFYKNRCSPKTELIYLTSVVQKEDDIIDQYTS